MKIKELNVNADGVSVVFDAADPFDVMDKIAGLARGTHQIIEVRAAALDAVRIAQPEPKAAKATQLPEPAPEPPKAAKAGKATKAAPPPEADEDDEPEDEDDEPAPPPKATTGKVKVRVTEELKAMRFRNVIEHLIGLGITSKRELVKQVEALVDDVPSVAKIAAKDDLAERVATTAEFIDANIKP